MGFTQLDKAREAEAPKILWSQHTKVIKQTGEGTGSLHLLELARCTRIPNYSWSATGMMSKICHQAIQTKNKPEIIILPLAEQETEFVE